MTLCAISRKLEGVDFMRYKNTDAVPIKEERDFVEIVRCKKCKFYDVLWLKCLHPRHIIVMGIDDFCSHGEREGKG